MRCRNRIDGSNEWPRHLLLLDMTAVKDRFERLCILWANSGMNDHTHRASMRTCECSIHETVVCTDTCRDGTHVLQSCLGSLCHNWDTGQWCIIQKGFLG